MFNHSSQFSIKGKNTFTNVRGNQVNGNVYTGTVNFNTGPAAAKRTQHDEFQYVRCGDMIATKEIHSEELSEWDWELQNGELVGRHKSSTRKTICTVEIVHQQSKYTTMIYEGEDAQKLWEEDFRHFSRNKKPGSFQLFGINQSAIPVLIFHYELIPCAHFFNEESIWMDIYIQHLMTNMRSNGNNIWMNTAGGVLFSGPDGPLTVAPLSYADESIVVPTTVDMLRDDTCVRFFINFGSSVDDSVLECAGISFEITDLDNFFPATAEDHQSEDSDHPNWSSAAHPYLRRLWRNPPDHLPMNVIGRLRFDTVYSPSMEAVATWPPGAGSLWEWHEYQRKGLVEETVLDGGLTRFKLDLNRGEEVYLEARNKWRRFRQGWLSQSSRVFNAVEITEGKEKFFIVGPPWLTIRSTQHPTASRTLRNDDLIEETLSTPIYLFLCPFPISVSELVSWMEGQPYFWSFDETGQSRILLNDSVRLRSWSTYIYTTLQDWQKARGFDPTTSDWARHMGYSQEWEIVGTRKVQGQQKAGRSWWQWEAVAESGISAFGF
ncbi:hypothetical protein Moror_15828 [Moniliophthora roreri MCA 2997]|uniref:Uncharacterized protein n=1 Tax=Moniliophthora roreri (strain MCA 2997) TaxID=1381753 RepID=V2W4J4_MONRO|nr:hypothetical protein Moror_15828 [Moniliophthora roreri MCA 2997]